MERTRSNLEADLPDGWYFKDSHTLLAPDGQANVIVSSEPLDPTIDTNRYCEVQGDLLRREFPGYYEAANGEFALKDGTPLRWRQFSWTPPNGVAVAQLQLYAVREGRGFTATATTPLPSWTFYEPVFRQIFESLTIADRGPNPHDGSQDRQPLPPVPPDHPLASRMEALSARPSDIFLRLDLVADLVAAGRHDDAFALLSRGYEQALTGDVEAATEMRHALGAMSSRMASLGGPPLAPVGVRPGPPPARHGLDPDRPAISEVPTLPPTPVPAPPSTPEPTPPPAFPPAGAVPTPPPAFAPPPAAPTPPPTAFPTPAPAPEPAARDTSMPELDAPAPEPGWGAPPSPPSVSENTPDPAVFDPDDRVLATPNPEESTGLDLEFERPPVTLDDVAGLEEVKSHIDSVVMAPVRNPELAAKFGRSPSGGLLMWGPPGVGKTFLARALAGSLDVGFSSVGMDEVLDMWLGSSERNMASVFAKARDAAPCIVFLDEVDALGGRRSRMATNASMRSVVSQLLVEMDGATRDNTGLFVVGATNLPWDIDPALRRPGRFDRTIFVPPPDRAARTAILAGRLASVPLDNDLNLDRISAGLAGLSGADVGQVADSAITVAFDQSLSQAADGAIVPVGQRHLEEAAHRQPSSISDWIALTTVAAESSNDTALFDPFLRWAASGRGR